jgi:hypothetical protein
MWKCHRAKTVAFLIEFTENHTVDLEARDT